MKLYKILRNVKSIILFLFAFTSFGIAQFENEPKAVIKPMAYDFGYIVQDSVVTYYFVITNEGGDLLKITNVSASCGCTAVMPEKNELNPGESTNIKVSFDSKGRSGKQTKIITIETNDPQNSKLKLSFTGNVLKKELQSGTQGTEMHNMDQMGMKEHNHQQMKMDNSKSEFKSIDMDTNKTVKESIIREGEIDLQAIDQNKDGKVFQDQMDWNVISDEAGKCPICEMTLKEVTIDEAKYNLNKNGFEVKD